MNILEGFTNLEIDERVGRLAKSERKITHLILSHILEVERRKLYLDFGLTSVYKYLTQRHGYCESSAYLRISAAKVFAQNPQLEEKIEDGSIKLSQLAKVQKCVRQNLKSKSGLTNTGAIDAEKMLRQLENKTSFETEAILAIEFQEIPRMDSCIIPQSDRTVRIEFSLTAEQFESFCRLQNHLSHIVPSGDAGELFVHLTETKLKAIEGKTMKHKNSANDFQNDAVTFTDKDNTKRDRAVQTQRFAAREIFKGLRKRKHIRRTLRRRLLQSCGHQCQFIDTESELRCDSSFQLQVDHVIPLAKGGSDAEENLRILCATHNRAEAIRHGIWRPNQ